ncbi:hypothetical protein [Mycobacterium sp.]|uniref:hypothetical protein n=1 Tax=Mycobacterium sp. TaxID=1785 RepID=UPI002D84C242|nr:hypothetical protein [Mycobacterium sp.]
MREWLRKRGALIPLGYSWTFVVMTDVSMILEGAERIGRQAMADIRRIVGLLDVAPMNRPGARLR